MSSTPRNSTFSRYLNSITLNLVRDDELDHVQRAYLREFTTPRVALDGSVVWLLEEVQQE